MRNVDGYIYHLNESQSRLFQCVFYTLAYINHGFFYFIDIRDIKKMEELGREMVRSCAGLPLAIMVLGGILVTKPSLIE